MKRGDKFIHAKWLDDKNQPLRCEVTRAAHGLIYWKAEGERKAKHFFSTEESSRYVKERIY